MRVRAGDEAAFERIFREHYATLCSFAESLVRSRESAEEMVQSVFLNVWTNRARWEVRGSVRAYLFGAMRNQALNHLKRGRLEHAWAEEATKDDIESLHGSFEDPARGVEVDEMAAAVRAAIERLPPRARMAVHLRWERQLKHAEIAEAMGISVKGVENQLSRALAALRGLLEPPDG